MFLPNKQIILSLSTLFCIFSTGSWLSHAGTFIIRMSLHSLVVGELVSSSHDLTNFILDILMELK